MKIERKHPPFALLGLFTPEGNRTGRLVRSRLYKSVGTGNRRTYQLQHTPAVIRKSKVLSSMEFRGKKADIDNRLREIFTLNRQWVFTTGLSELDFFVSGAGKNGDIVKVCFN